MSEFAGDGEADASARRSFGEGGMEAGEGREDSLAGGRGNTGAIVGESDENLLGLLLGAEAGDFTVSGVFFDVGEQISENLLTGVGVGEDLRRVGKIGFDFYPRFVEGGDPVGENVVEGLVEVERLEVELELLAFRTSEGEDVVDEAREAAGLGGDDVELLGCGFIGGERLGGELAVEADVGEGSFEFVADLIDKGDPAGGFAESAVVFAQEPERNDEEGESEGREIEENGFGESRLVLGNEWGVVL